MSKRLIILPLLLLALGWLREDLYAQGPQNRDVGFGLLVGDPFGGTLKYWLHEDQAIVGSIGSSYFRSAPRVGIDYQWTFDLLNTSVIRPYVGPGIVVGISRGTYYWSVKGKTADNDYINIGNLGVTGFAARAAFGLNIFPARTPLEFFVEGAPLLGIMPKVVVGFDFGIGVRFYP
jgi:hypothetical protein